MTNQDSAIRTNQTVQMWIPQLHKNGPTRNYGRNFLYKKWSLLCLGGAYFQFPPEAEFPQFEKSLLNKVSPFIVLQIEDSCWHWIGGSKFRLTTLTFLW